MSVYNDDELEAPSWLSKEFLKNILRNYEKDDELEVINIKITPATFKGDHFASSMFRAKVEYNTVRCTKIVSHSYIIKTLPELDSLKLQMLSEYKIFETEISMYTEALPKIEKILAEYGDNTRFAPKVVYTSLKPIKILIFEDLCELGYDAIRGRHLNVNELKQVLLKLAKLHAVSYKIGKSKKAEEVTKYQDGLFSNPKMFENEFMGGGIKRFKRLLESNEELRAYLPQFEEVEEDIKRDCVDLYAAAFKNDNAENIFVLNHGDFHLKNLMFKFNEENQLEDYMMVDFQFSVFGPSIIDITYATYMMFDLEQRLEKYDEILRFYFENFIATLKKIDFQGELPSYAQFQISKLKYRRFAVYMLCTFLPAVFKMAATEPKDLKDDNPYETLNNSDKLMFLYLNPSFIEDIKKNLPVLLHKGYLD